MFHTISSIIQNTLIITAFVMVMMLLIEYVNVSSQGRMMARFRTSPAGQLLLASLLGLLPGCLGGFVVVSLFTHGILSFGALVACMIATIGDEAFVLLALEPGAALVLSAILLLLALTTGAVVNLTVKQFPVPFDDEHFKLHESDSPDHADIRGNWRYNLKHVTFERALLLTALVAIIVFIMLGWLDHDHATHDMHSHGDIHHADEHPDSLAGLLLQERWLNILFAVVCAGAAIIIARVNDHFLKEHLWEHIIRKHLPPIFLWTLGILAVLEVGQYFFNLEGWVEGNTGYMLLVAVLIGLIPESGPHMVFITLYAAGTVPFSVLLTNSIVQEGHAGLPLLAESKKGFIWMKAISVAVALVVGFVCFKLGY